MSDQNVTGEVKENVLTQKKNYMKSVLEIGAEGVFMRQIFIPCLLSKSKPRA